MEETSIKFGGSEIKKQKFHQYKRPISVKNEDINKIVVSNKALLVKMILNISLVKKVRPLCIFLPKMNAYRKGFDETKHISFLIKHNF